MDTFNVIYALSVLTIIGQVIAIAIAIALILSMFGNRPAIRIRNFISSHATVFMFIVAVVATTGSLFFSEIALLAPCKDCWIQRIFMYPQVVLLAVALLRKDRNIAWYILPISLLGFAMSSEHYIEQWESILNPLENDNLVPCDLSGISCSATYVFLFGYITIPLMAATAFAMNILASASMILQRWRN